tara:strand:+ start:456 stop:1643 length:1188 start_codon:yes stop_codon:yes gene_type:complete
MNLFPKKIMLLGSGELGKEITIYAKRLGCHVIACDSYPNAPAMQVADTAEVFDMKNSDQLKQVVHKRKPDIIIPEIEALEVNTLNEIEKEGITIIPNARATGITMNRDRIRDLASKELGLQTADFAYASSCKEVIESAKNLKFPVIIKPIMSSSGKGQSLINKKEDLEKGWEVAMKGARGKSTKVIIEEFINFDLEITLLTIRQKNGSTIFCDPIGHEQTKGDYQCSWQPAKLNSQQLNKAQSMARIVTDNLGGVGLFGVEFFIAGEEVIFSELSPRPHDTGLVTLISQNLNEFELHLRAILGLPIPEITRDKAAASRVILAKESIEQVGYSGIEEALKEKNTRILLFGKPSARKGRRMGVALSADDNVIKAREKADRAASLIDVLEIKDSKLLI